MEHEVNMFDSDNDSVDSNDNCNIVRRYKCGRQFHVQLFMNCLQKIMDETSFICCPGCGELLELTQYCTLWCTNCNKEYFDENFCCNKKIDDGNILIQCEKTAENNILSLIYVLTSHNKFSYTKILMIVSNDDVDKIIYYQPKKIDMNILTDLPHFDINSRDYCVKPGKYAGYFHCEHFERNIKLDNIPDSIFKYI